MTGETTLTICSAWREHAEHIAGSLSKGARVVVVGQLKQRGYQDREGNNRSSIELEVDEIGPSLRYATAQVTRTAPRNGSSGRPSSAPYGAPGDQPVDQSGAWSTGGSYGDDTPF